MKSFHRVVLCFGIASSIVGLLLVISPALASLVRVSNVGMTLSLLLVGLLAFVLAARDVLGELEPAADAGDDGLDPFEHIPEPERRPQYPRLGSAFVRRLDAIQWADRRKDEPESHAALRADLSAIADGVLSWTNGWSRSEIEIRLADGSWTENRHAAGFFADGAPSTSIRDRLRAFRTAEPPFARRGRHAMAELASVLVGSSVSPRPTSETPSVEDAPPATVSECWSNSTDNPARDRLSGRLRWIVVASLVAGGLGIFARQPGLLLIALFGIAVVGSVRATALPTVAVEIDRTVTETEPEPGRDVTVSVTVQNTGQSTLTDLRLIDGVPPGLEVTDGSPRLATALRPGKRATFSYTVETVAGAHEFEPPLVIARDFTGLHERRTLASATPTRIECRPPATPTVAFELQPRATVNPGQARTTVTGAGVEFHSIREYRPGDPVARVDWNRKAKTGELATVDFREPRLARVTVLIDARRAAYVSADSQDQIPAVRWSVDAGRCLVDSLLEEGTPVGVAALSPRICWTPPGAGEAHHLRIHDELTNGPAFDWTPPADEFDESTAIAELRQRLAPDTQVIVISPLCDDGSTRLAKHLDACGRSVTVVSPDPTSHGEPLDYRQGYAHVARRFRVRELRGFGIDVLDWDVTIPFEEAVGRGR